MPEQPIETDVLVVGGGPGGYVAAIRAGQLGLDVTLVERDAYGGTCLQHGCIPSKALISAADRAHGVRAAAGMGITADVTVDFEQMISWKDSVVDRLTTGVERLCKANRVRLKPGTASFVDAHTARIKYRADGEEMTDCVEFAHAIIATGSAPIEIPGFSFDDPPVLDSSQALSLDAVPERLVIVGGGYIGFELAQVFAKLGTEVSVLEMLDTILPGYDEELTEPVRRRSASLGVSVNTGHSAERWSESADGITVVAENEAGDPAHFDADVVLVAVGSRPVSDTVRPEKAGVETDGRGFIVTDDDGRTVQEHIFAVGDVAGEPMLAHKASMEGALAAEAIVGESTDPIDRRALPAVVFTDPEIATVGMSPPEAEAAGHAAEVGEFPFYASGRALTIDERDGFVQVVIDRDTEAVLGAQIVGPDAGELIGQFALAIDADVTASQFEATIFAHPTLGEGTKESIGNALGRAIHVLNR